MLPGNSIPQFSAPLAVEVIVAGPSLHALRSYFGNTFLHLIYSETDKSKNLVLNFDANLPFADYDPRQIFAGNFPVELHCQSWKEFLDLEMESRRRSIKQIKISTNADQRATLAQLLNVFPNIPDFPSHYAALFSNCSTLGLTCLRSAGLPLPKRPPILPILVPLHIARAQANWIPWSAVRI
jgi:Domain of unknown function (DUF4105)